LTRSTAVTTYVGVWVRLPTSSYGICRAPSPGSADSEPRLAVDSRLPVGMLDAAHVGCGASDSRAELSGSRSYSDPAGATRNPHDQSLLRFESFSEPAQGSIPRLVSSEEPSFATTAVGDPEGKGSRPIAPLGPPAPSPPAHRSAARARSPSLAWRVEWQMTALGDPGQ
jgi:hypothetical protein